MSKTEKGAETKLLPEHYQVILAPFITE